MKLQIIPVLNKVSMKGLCPLLKGFWVSDRLWFKKFIEACTQLHTVHYGLNLAFLIWAFLTNKSEILNSFWNRKIIDQFALAEQHRILL